MIGLFGGSFDADLIFDTFNEFEGIIKDVWKRFKHRVSFEEYLEATGEVIDEKIIEIEKKEKLRYIGGSCYFKASEETMDITARLELFFQDDFGRWIKKEPRFSVPIDLFKKDVQENFIPQMYKQEIKIDVEPPQTRERN